MSQIGERSGWSATKATRTVEFLTAILKRLGIKGARYPHGWPHSMAVKFVERQCNRYAERKRRERISKQKLV